MAKAFINDQNLTDIAEAIRGKLGTSTHYLPSEMSAAINSIPAGGGTGHPDPLCFTARTAGSTVLIRTPHVLDIKLQISTDGQTWYNWSRTDGSSYDTFATITLAAAGDKIYIRGDNSTMAYNTTSQSTYSKFAMTGGVEASGSIMSLLNSQEETYAICNCGFTRLFSDCAPLFTPPRLPATSGGSNCYNSMFYGCTNLEYLPDVNLDVLFGSSASSMFYDCRTATSCRIKSRYAAGQALGSMLYGCSSLVEIYVESLQNWQSANNFTNGVSATGDFYKLTANTSIPTGTNGIPSGWTVHNV